MDIKGGVVFTETAKDEIRWDGKNQSGKDVPEGTYFYLIKEPGQPDRKGYIELRR
jgi:flagellar hook assembly protein FlgD